VIKEESKMNKRENIEKQISTLKGIREMLDMNRTEFSRYMGIPLRTLEEWEAGRRQMPEYVLRLISYYVKAQQLLKEKGIELEEEDEPK
jgi:putative transcriptional regulator